MFFRKKYKPKFNYERYGEWVKCSIGWVGLESEMGADGTLMTRLQGLGIIDAELYDINKSDSQRVLDYDLTVFDHVNIKSYLWVLGVYEFFRTFDQTLQANPNLADEKITQLITDVKRELARLRVPLAKMEPSGKFRNRDYAVPRLGGNDVQIGWQINKDEIIWYRDLSDRVLSALIQLRVFRINRNLKNLDL